MDVNPGDFNPNQLTPGICAAKCGILQYQYAGVTGGNFCFCSNNKPPVEQQTVDTDCNIQCSGSTDNCGSKNHISVYQSSQPVVGLEVTSDAAPLISTGTSVSFDITIESGIGIYYQFSYDDGAGKSPKNSSAMYTYTYESPGLYSVSVFASDLNDTLPVSRAVTSVVVEDGVGSVDITCPAQCATFEYCLCEVKTYRGNNMNLIDTADGTTFPSFKIADPVYDTVGYAIPTVGPVAANPHGNGYYILENSEFLMEGKVHGINVYAEAIGLINVLVLTPDCGVQIYCPESFVCAASCLGYQTMDCTGGAFCPSSKTCDTCTGTSRDTAPNVLDITYTIKQTIAIDMLSLGYQHIPVIVDVPVSPGDILGFQQTGAGVVQLSTTTSLYEDYFFSATPFTKLVATTEFTDRCLINAVMSAPSVTLLHYEFTAARMVNVDVGITSVITVSPQSSSTSIDVLEGIDIAEIIIPLYLPTNENLNFDLKPHTGTDIVYTWNFEGSEENTTVLPYAHLFTAAGVYNVTIMAFNGLSQKSNFTEVTVEERIGVLTLSALPSSIGIASTFNFSMATGSDFTCQWDYGDGSAVEITNDTVTPSGGSISSVLHTYAAEGSFTVNVTCYNNIGSETITMIQPIASPIIGLTITSTGANKDAAFKITWTIAAGTSPVATLIFDGTTYTKDAVSNGFTETSNPALSWESTLVAGRPTGLYDLQITVENAVSTEFQNISFRVEVAMASVTSTVSSTNAPTSQAVTFTLDMTEGSSVNWVYDWDDGTFDNFSLAEGADWADRPTKMDTQVHLFTVGKIHNVKITAWNSGSTIVKTHTVTVVQSVYDVQLNNEDYYRFTPPAYPHFNFSTAGPAPNQAKAFFEFGDGKDATYDLTMDFNYIHVYRDIGTYPVTATISNAISELKLSTNVSIVEILQGLVIVSTPPNAAAVGDPFLLDVILYRAPTGPDCLIDINYGEGGIPDVVNHERTGYGQNGKDTFNTAIYTTVGTKVITVTITTPLETLTLPYNVEAQIKVITGVTITSVTTSADVPYDAPVTPITVTFTYPGDVSGPPYTTLPEYSLDFMDGSPPENGTFVPGNIPVAVPHPAHTLIADGSFMAALTIFNLASSETIYFHVGAYIDITNSVAATSYKPALPLDAPYQNGLGVAGEFPRDREVRFTMTHAAGTIIDYEIKYVLASGGPSTTVNRTDNPFTILFPDKGIFDVDITGRNPLYDDLAQTTVTMLDRVVDVQLADATPRVGPGEPRTFNVSFESQGDKTCLLVNFDDGSEQTWADVSTYCAFAGPAAFHVGPLTSLTEIEHIFNSNGYYNVKAYAMNLFSSSNTSVDAPVSSAKCTKPKVSIQDQSFQFFQPMLSKKSKILRVIGKSDIYCATTLQNAKSWVVETIDDNTGEVTSQVDITTLPTRFNAEIHIPPLFFDYDLYKFTYNMQMESDKFDGGVYTAYTHTYLRVEKSDLVALIEQGGISEVKRGFGSSITLDPAKWSFDPDDTTPIGSQTFGSFAWTCEGANENATAAMCDLLLPVTSLGDSPLTMDTNLVSARTDFKFCVTISKDSRSSKACLVIQLVSGTPPSVYLECTASSVCNQQESGQLIPPSGRLGVRCECTDCLITDVISYKWIFYTYDYRWPWKDIENIANYAVGIYSKELSIDRSLFDDFAPVTKFRAGCEATRSGDVSKGLAYMNFELNAAPTDGFCNISKTEGVVSVKKEFCIMCYGWEDINGIAEYQLIVRFKDDDVDREVIALNRFDEPICIDLPMGAAYNLYKEKVFVQIRDTLGSVNEYFIAEVIVKPLPLSATQELMKNFVTNDFDTFDKTYAEGDTNAIAALTSNLVAILNSDSKDAQGEYAGVGVASSTTNTGFGPSDADRTGAFVKTETSSNPALNQKYEEEKDIRSQLKQQAVIALSSVTAASTTSIKQVSSGLAELFHYPEEVTLKAASTALDKTLEMAKYMSNISGITYEDRKSTFIYMAATIGGALDAIGFNGDHPSLTELVEAKALPEFKVYDTNWENTKDAIVAENLEAAMGEHSQHTHKNLAGSESVQYIDKAVETITLLTKGFSQNSVPGEEIEFVTNRLQGIVKNSDAKSLLGAPIGIKGSEAALTLPNDLFPSSKENDSFVLQVLQTTSAPYQYSEHSKDLGATSNAIVIEMYDDFGNLLVIKNLATPVEFTIPRDKKSPINEYKVSDPLIVDWDYLFYHTVNITKKGASLHIEFKVEDANLKFLVLVRFGDFPSIPEKLFDYIGTIPDNSVAAPYSYTYYLSNKEVNDYIGTVYIGVRQLNQTEYGATFTTAADIPNYKTGTGQPTEKYKIRTFSTGCYFFDDILQDWSSKGCWVGPKTNQNNTHCYCNHLTTFAGGWVVVPNTIDWNFVFANADFAKNPTLYITEIVIAALYIIVVIWARREDKKDLERIGLTPLKDNDPRDKYFYEVCVVTGMRRNAGTDSKVCFILSGEYDETDVRMFSDSKRKIFRRGAVDAFLLAVPRPLGTLNYARVWHDNSGKGKSASWYLKYLLVRDIQTNHRQVFICNKWFAVEEDDGQVDRVIPVAGKEQMTEFGHMFAEKSRKNLVDGHLWFSVVARPANSRFTRVQRVSCCLLLLFVSMLGNAMFYGQDLSSTTAYSIGPFALSPEQIFIGIAVNLLVFPINLLVVTLFRKSRARKMRPSRIDEALKRGGLSAASGDSDIKQGMEGVWMSRSPTMSLDDHKRAGTSASMRPETSFSSMSRMGNTNYESLKSDSKKKKKKFELPWWCTILGWILLWLGVGVSLAFVTFYGITFQDEKCKKWITSMLMSFFTSVFITQPVKVFLMAIFFSLVVKNPGEEEDEVEDEESHKLASDEEFLHFEDGYGATRPRKIGYKPPNAAELEKARFQRLNEIKMWEIIREIVFYSFFLWILMVISYRNRSPDGYFYKHNLVKTFIDNNDTVQLFSRIRNTAEFWKWSQSGLLNGIRASNYYNSDPPLLLRGFVNDKVSRIMGYATMRQLRVRQGLCETRGVMKNVIFECNEAYSFDNEDEGTYHAKWQPLDSTETVNDTTMEWKYTEADILNGYPYMGLLEVYGGGGYVVQLRGSKGDIGQKLKELEDDDWIDQYTRAVFVEFTIYNPQVNLFAVGTIVSEFDRSGGVTTSSRFEPANLLPYMSSVMLFQIACEVTYLLFTAYFIIRAIKSIFKEKLQYFMQFWNIIELGIIAVSIGAVIVYFYRLIITNELTAIFARSHGNEYMKFQYAGYWNEMLTYMIGWLVFFGTLKFLKLLRFNKRMALVAATLSNGSKSLLHFGIIFIIVYMAFMQLFYLTYMNLSSAFQTFIKAMESGVLMMMGKFDIYSMLMVEPVLTQIFVFCFVVTITFILVNMFLSILNETFGAVREDINKVNNDYEIVDFMVTRFKRWTGMGAAPSNTLEPSDLLVDGKPNPYAGPQDNVAHFPDRIDKLLNSISNIYMDEDGVARRMTAKQQAANKSDMKNMLRGHSSQDASGLTDIEN